MDTKTDGATKTAGIRPLNHGIFRFEGDGERRELELDTLEQVSGGAAGCLSLQQTCRTFICTCEGPPSG